MELDRAMLAKILRDLLLSILIYALPVALMFISFVITGERPWHQASQALAPSKLTARHAGDFK